MQKSLSLMNLQLHQVLSDVTGASGLAILDGILAGNRDPMRNLLISPLLRSSTFRYALRLAERPPARRLHR
jgi:hypothetical protein